MLGIYLLAAIDVKRIHKISLSIHSINYLVATKNSYLLLLTKNVKFKIREVLHPLSFTDKSMPGPLCSVPVTIF